MRVVDVKYNASAMNENVKEEGELRWMTVRAVLENRQWTMAVYMDGGSLMVLACQGKVQLWGCLLTVHFDVAFWGRCLVNVQGPLSSGQLPRSGLGSTRCGATSFGSSRLLTARGLSVD